MGNSKSFRDAGWAQLGGQWGAAAIFTLVYVVVDIAVSSVETALLGTSFLTSLLFLPPMVYAFNIAFLENKRSGKAFNAKDLFIGFNDYIRVTGTYLLQSLYVFLWTLLLIVPGVIKSISYSQTMYILKDCPELSFNAAIERSMAMMEGHKWGCFKLYLSFIGWVLLAIVTLGIALFWVAPYMSATFANYYEQVKAEYENKIAA